MRWLLRRLVCLLLWHDDHPVNLRQCGVTGEVVFEMRCRRCGSRRWE